MKTWLTALALGMASLYSNAYADLPSSYTAQNSVVYPISRNLPDLEFALKTRDNRLVTQEDVKGKVAVLFFGFAHCPDICPLTLAQLTQILKKLGPTAKEQIQILFISVDPLRDTPDLVQNYVDSFNNGAIGLSGTPEEIRDLARRYRVSYQVNRPVDADEDTDYEVMHGRGIYIFDKLGKVRFLASDADNPEPLSKALKSLLP